MPLLLLHARLHPSGSGNIGPTNNTDLDFISDLVRYLTRSTRDTREPAFLFQRLHISIQCFNTTAFWGIFTDVVYK